MVSFGVSSGILKCIAEHPFFFRLFGGFKYWVASLIYNLAPTTPSFDMVCTCSEGVTTINQVYLGALGNGKYFGGGMKICPDAELSDGLMNFVCLHHLTKPYIFFSLSRELGTGNHVCHRGTAINESVCEMRITPSGEKVMWVEADGELIGKGSLVVKIKRDGLVLIV